MFKANGRRRSSPIVWAVLASVVAPASAQDVDVRVVQERLLEMEREMRELRALVETHGRVTAAKPDASVTSRTATQATTVAPATGAGTTFSFGGFIKLDAMTTSTSDGKIADGSAGRLFYFPAATPVAPDGQAKRSTYSDLHAQFSRFSLGANTVTEAGDAIKAYIEADMYGGGSNALAGNEAITNTYALTLRQAYVSYKGWLAGQTWSNFQDVAALPDAVDFTGPSEGTVFNRQAQLRHTRGAWSFSMENPQTTVTPYLAKAARFNSGDNRLPDVTARWMHRADWGHFTIAGLARSFRSGDATAQGFALSVSGSLDLGANDNLRYMVSGGDGIGRYLGFALGSDTVLDATGVLHSQRGYGGFTAWRHTFGPKLRGNLIYSVAALDNDVAMTGRGVTQRAQSFRMNMIYSPASKFDIGGELSWADRRLENGSKGDLQRVQTHVKYSF